MIIDRFDDLQLSHKRSSYSSRTMADVEDTLHRRLECARWSKLPVCASHRQIGSKDDVPALTLIGEGMRPTGAIRDRKYKLVEWFEDGRVELYNLAVDPGETTNLVKSEPKIAARLLSSFQTWRDRVGVQMPTLR